MAYATDQTSLAQSQTGGRFPRLPLYSALSFVGFAFVAIVFGQATGIGTVRLDLGAPAAIRDIVLFEEPGETIGVKDAVSGSVIATYGVSEGGFVRGSVRGLQRMRLVAGVPPAAPYRLIRWDNGAVSLSDTATGERLYLEAFGPDNAAAFASLLGDGSQNR